MKCRDYKEYSVLCLNCEFPLNVKCCKEFDFETPKKYVIVKRNDMTKFTWNECPTCGTSIGYHPKDTDFRCVKCGQRILWD